MLNSMLEGDKFHREKQSRLGDVECGNAIGKCWNVKRVGQERSLRK